MAATTFKHIPSHNQWKTARDGAGGKSGLCGKVNVGKLLDAFAAAGAVMAKRTAALEKLQAGFVAYTADAKVKAIPDLHKTAMSIFEVVKKELLAGKQAKDVGLAIGLKVGDGLKRIAAIKALIAKDDIDEAGLTYEKFWDGIGRGVGQQLPNGALRDGWNAVHSAQPDRGKIGNAKDTATKKQLVEDAIADYQVALDDLLKDAKAAGLDVKLG